MKNPIFLFLGLCLTILSCEGIQEYSQPYETTVTVVDMDGKPIKNRLVKVLNKFYQDDSYNNFIEGKELNRAITNNDGIAILRYKLLRAEFVAEWAWIIVADDTLFKSIMYLTHVQEQTQLKLEDEKKLKGTIKMDSLVPLKIRIKTNRDYAYEYSILATMQYSRTGEFDPIMNRTFANIFVKNKRYKLDTTITTMVYSKANFGVTTRVDGYGKYHPFTKDSVRSIVFDEF